MTMKALLYPLLVQVTLTFAVMFRMYAQRSAEFRTERIRPREVATRREAMNRLRSSAASSDNFSNQFEMPVLFYTAVVLAVTLLVQDLLLVMLAWIYVGLRVIHAAIHLSYNDVLHRFYAFVLSAFVLLAIWLRLGALIVLY
ncbi:MAG: MAPEG family protein [Gammaproteobacteria bacterium]